MRRNLTHKLVMRPRGVSELYDLKEDPRELRNVYGEPKYSELQAELMEGLLAWEIETSDVTPMHRDGRGYPKYPHAASTCAMSGVDGPH